MRSGQVVALHGFLGRGADWDGVRAASRAGLEWICPDLFAHGSGRFDAAFEGVRGAWLAGYSFGGRLALRLLAAEPGRWRGALLLSVNPGNFLGEGERSERRAADRVWAEAFRRDPWPRVIERWDAQEVFGWAAPPPRREGDYDRGLLAAALEARSVADDFTDPARLSGRLLWLAGERDTKFVALAGTMHRAGFPGIFIVVPGAGHRLLHEAPGAVAAAFDRLVSAPST